MDVELCSHWYEPGWDAKKYISRDDCDDDLMKGAVRDSVVSATVIGASISGVAGLLFVAVVWIGRGFKKRRTGTSKTVE